MEMMVVAVDIAHDRHPSHKATDTQHDGRSHILPEGLHYCQRIRYPDNTLHQLLCRRNTKMVKTGLRIVFVLKVPGATPRSLLL